jgi:hypothetical protein
MDNLNNPKALALAMRNLKANQDFQLLEQHLQELQRRKEHSRSLVTPGSEADLSLYHTSRAIDVLFEVLNTIEQKGL